MPGKNHRGGWPKGVSRLGSDLWTRRMANMVRLIASAAAKGEQCPNVHFFRNSGLVGDPNVCLKKLIAEGVVRVELWRHRYRVVEVLKGKHAGARTKEYEGPDLCPKRIIDVTEENGGQTLKKQGQSRGA